MALRCTTTTKAADPAVFLGGCPRSGTTLLQRMLDHHPQLAIANDTHFVPRALEIVDPMLLDAAAAGDEIPLTDQLTSAVWNYHRFYRLGVNEAQFHAAVQRASNYRQLVAELFAEFTKLHGKPLGGEKTPDYVRNVPALLGMFPDAKFVHIVRDGRNVALSLQQWATPEKGPGRLALWDHDPIAVSALWWKSFVEAELPSRFVERYYVVGYEQLVANPVAVLEPLCAFLEIEFAPAMVEFHAGKQSPGKGTSAKSQWLPATSGLRDWRDQMSAEDVAVFESLVADTLCRFGYELSDAAIPKSQRTPTLDAEVAERVNRARSWWNAPVRKRRPKQPSANHHESIVEAGARGIVVSDDHAVIAADAQLDNLETLLVNEKFCDVAQRFLECPDDVRATYVRYKPETNCLVAYSHEDGTPFGYAIGYRADSQDKLQNAELYFQSESPQAGFVDADQRIAFYRFPHDARLTQLTAWNDPQARVKTLRTMLPGVELPADALRVTCLSYKPNRRCVAKVASAAGPIGVLRICLPSAYLRARQAAKYVPQSSWNRSDRLGQSDRHATLLVRWVDGSALQPAEIRTRISDIGCLLAEIHGSPQPKLPVDEIPHRLAALDSNVDSLTELMPCIVSRADRLREFAASTIASTGHLLTLGHGDFHASQIIETGDGLAVIDWDNALNAAAGFDIGSFAAHAYWSAVRLGETAAPVHATIDELVDAYRAARQLSVEALANPIVDAFVVYGLLSIATHPFRHRVCNWQFQCERLIEQAERHLDRALGAGRGSRAADVPTADFVQNPLEKDRGWLAEPLSLTHVSQKLLPLVRTHLRSRDARLSRITVLAHKLDRRCAAKYCFTDAAGTHAYIAKIRAKGVDLLAVDIQRRLFDEVQASGRILQVAEPVGTFAEWRLWLQTRLDGQTAEQLISPDSDSNISHRIGMALGELHHFNLPIERTHRFEDESAILADALHRTAEKSRPLADRIHQLSDDCQTLLQRLTLEHQSGWTGIHRDFHPGQVLCTTSHIGVVDLDLFARAHPAIDLGNYIAHLKELALRQYENADALKAHEHAFVDGYHSIASRVEQSLIDAMTIASLARHIFISRRISERKHTTLPILEHCEQLISKNQHQSHSTLPTTR